MIQTISDLAGRICQGDIIRDLDYIESIHEEDGIIEVSKIIFPLVIVLTQDCDLHQDFVFRHEKLSDQDKLIISVLVAPLYNSEHFFIGEHLSEVGIKSRVFPKRTKTPCMDLMKNKNPRYHYVEFPCQNKIVNSIIDFKHYFSVNGRILERHKQKNFACTVSPLYREDISQRFSAFLSRIGLP